MRKPWIAALALAIAAATLGAAASWRSGATAEESKLRVGTYDNRAIAVAYAHSSFMKERYEKMKSQRHAARKAGDNEKVEELEALASWEQRKLHYQGFGRAPVGDLLAHVKDQIPQVAKQARVDVIAWEYDFLPEGTQKVDVTDLLVERFSPSEQALRIIEELKEQEPVPLREIDRQGHDH